VTTTITPTSGAGVLFTQQGVGTSPGYSALDLRRSEIIGPVQEGVYGQFDFAVNQRGAGANMSVDIAAGGFAAIQGDSVAAQGLYITGAGPTINEAIAAADPTNPRIDIVIVEVLDNVHDASGGNLARTRVITGTPTAGATLNNRSGVAALPGSALLLGDVLVGAAAGSITNAVIRDRRKWARGAYARIVHTGGNKTTTNTTLTEADTTNLKPRIECSGNPVKLTFSGFANHSVGAVAVIHGWFLDGAAIDSVSTGMSASVHPTAAAGVGFMSRYVAVPAAGSHQFSPAYAGAGAGTSTLTAAAAQPLVLTVEELVRQNVANNTTTSG
jgi:hypothetical protein